MNDLPDRTITGTFGELLVQMRLLEYGVQACFPLKDSGNDLLAVRGPVVKSIQVRASADKTYRNRPEKTKKFDLLAAVHLVFSSGCLSADTSRIFLIPREESFRLSIRFSKLEQYELSGKLVDSVWEHPL
jgi:hypothetical protein